MPSWSLGSRLCRPCACNAPSGWGLVQSGRVSSAASRARKIRLSVVMGVTYVRQTMVSLVTAAVVAQAHALCAPARSVRGAGVCSCYKSAHIINKAGIHNDLYRCLVIPEARRHF
jgi:hypothetical protein